MDPDRKRKIRLVVALGAAVLLAAGLVYTSFSAGTETQAALRAAPGSSGDTYQLTGEVATDSVERDGTDLDFEIADRDDAGEAIPVDVPRRVPDPFREGREVIVTGTARPTAPSSPRRTA